MPQSVAAFKKRLNDYNAMGCVAVAVARTVPAPMLWQLLNVNQAKVFMHLLDYIGLLAGHNLVTARLTVTVYSRHATMLQAMPITNL